jgi:dCTP deaminase
MSIKSDLWIKRMCQAPDGIIENGLTPLFLHKQGDHWVLRDTGVPAEHYLGEIRELTREEKRNWLQVHGALIEPFESGQVRYRTKEDVVHLPAPVIGSKYAHFVEQEKIVSYGLSSYGYDVRCADEFKIFTNINSTVVDPKNFDEKSFVDFKGDVCVIPPNSFALARTVERFKIPRDVLTICLGKSTYARCGIIVNVTPFEPEWEGYVTLEFSNTTPLPAKIYANEGVAQVLFLQSDEACDVSYKDRGGKYMNQGDQPVCPKV